MRLICIERERGGRQERVKRQELEVITDIIDCFFLYSEIVEVYLVGKCICSKLFKETILSNLRK